MELTAYLDQQLRAQGIPMDGVSLVTTADRSSWVVSFKPEATQAQKDQAASFLATVPTDSTTITNATVDTDALAALGTLAKALCAVMLDTKLNRPLTTGDIPAVQAMFTKAKTYYRFIVQNGL